MALERAGWRTEILEILESHRDDTGSDENAVEVMRRLSRAWQVVQLLRKARTDVQAKEFTDVMPAVWDAIEDIEKGWAR